MASTFESLLTIILFTLLVEGHGRCALQDITVGTERTPNQIQGKQEWKVSFINTCKNCTQRGLMVSCDDFLTVEKVERNVFAPLGNNQCLVNGGHPIAPSGVFTFLYAWDPPFLFVPVSSHVHCGLVF